MMRTIDMQNWSRRQHFGFFSSFDHPHFGMCVNVDMTAFYPFVKQHDYSLTIAIVYVIARASNAIPEFRLRIRDGQVVEYETVHPGFTILVEADIFSFCITEYNPNFPAFAEDAITQIAAVRENPWVTRPREDNLLYTTAIPWVSFSSFKHPMHYHPCDSIPRFAWGRITTQGDSKQMPLDATAHHALMDGVHMGKFYQQVQTYLNEPEIYLG
jgi:chloramphenicol O-acetyltransferase type A